MGRPPHQHDYPYAEIGGRLRAARSAKGFSQTELAELLGFKFASAYQKLESGQHAPSVDVLRRAVSVLGITPNELLLDPDTCVREAQRILDDAEDAANPLPENWNFADRVKEINKAHEKLRQTEASLKAGTLRGELISEAHEKITKPVKRPPGVPPLEISEPKVALRRKQK